MYVCNSGVVNMFLANVHLSFVFFIFVIALLLIIHFSLQKCIIVFSRIRDRPYNSFVCRFQTCISIPYNVANDMLQVNKCRVNMSSELRPYHIWGKNGNSRLLPRTETKRVGEPDSPFPQFRLRPY